MALSSRPSANSTDVEPIGPATPPDYRARQALEEHERAQQKRREVAEQRSLANPPSVRIRAWEKVHGLQLPSDSAHPILDVIAVCTRLTLAEVQAEQRARAGLPAA